MVLQLFYNYTVVVIIVYYTVTNIPVVNTRYYGILKLTKVGPRPSRYTCW